MDSHSSGYFLNHATFPSVYYQTKEDGGLIDLGLSLGTLQPETSYHHPSGHEEVDDYSDLIEWNQLHPQLKATNMMEYAAARNSMKDKCEEETEGVQSKERWAYVKVNMDGVVVGRKICILDHSTYSTLAVQLEDMFGRHTNSGLRLFQAGSEFSLLHKDGRDEQWSLVGHAPWKEFVECVKRLRIVRKDGILVSSSSAFA